ncbi:MAG: S-layer homology domain-containing protein [Clostridia bacterium]|nr:S-layer homology domain-containing protein [Clostridia bacterium]
MCKYLAFILAIVLLAGFALPALAADKDGLDTAVNKAAAYMLNTVKDPQVDSVGGEWAVIGLARSGYDVPEAWFEGYYKSVEKYVKERGGILHEVKYTEYSRVILGLTAAGYDPRDVAGCDLTGPLQDFDKTVWQGVNGPIFALIALDSMNYPNSRRDDYVAEILRRQLNDGGWNLTGGASADTKNQAGDPDITGMALQALAKYQDKPEVKAATDKALACLSELQNAEGGYTSWGGENNESTVQVLVALCELGIPLDDARFVKKGHTLVDYILSFQNADGSFTHMRDGGGNSQMSSEQALYGLVAAQRARDGKNSLYRMGDAAKRGVSASRPTASGLPGKHADVAAAPLFYPGKTFTDITNHANRIAIESLAARGIINGKSETSFDPEATMTRAEFAAIVTRALSLPEKTASPFLDVHGSAWYAKPVTTAYFYEIVSGTSTTTFNPNGTITRQEAAVMVVRAAKLCGMDTAQGETEIRDTLAQFGDYRTVASWAQSSLAFCYGTGILDDDALDIKPSEAVKRCEIAEMLYRMLERAELI